MDPSTRIAVMAGIVSALVSALGVVTNFIINSKRERRFSSLQDTKIELEAFNAVRAEAEIIRKELRLTIQEQAKEITALETENRRLEKDIAVLTHSHELLQREYDNMKRECDRQSVTNELMRKDLEDLRRRLP